MTTKHSTQFERQHHEVSRALEYFSEDELRMQIGHEVNAWPLVLVKELIDNALDATEPLRRPVVKVRASENRLEVEDNGPGLPAHVIKKSLDYLVRVSDKALYVSPSRGQLGNALKCVWAAPFVASGEGSGVIVESQGIRHEVRVRINHLRREPVIDHNETESAVSEGTIVKIEWPEVGRIACYQDQFELGQLYIDSLRELIFRFALFNPHATFRYTDEEEFVNTWEATDPDWKRWHTQRAPSAWWFNEEQFRNLIAATADRDPETTVREFLLNFDGMKATARQKQVASESELTGQTIMALIDGDQVDEGLASRLRINIQGATRPVLSKALGVIGDKHFESHLLDRMQTEDLPANAKAFNYQKVLNTPEDVKGGETPWVCEAGFGARKDMEGLRVVIPGLNGSPTIKNPTGEILDALEATYAENNHPVVQVVHFAKPDIAYAEHGKGAMIFN